tara:strand:- start:47 stop:532 length:486 start_codon:yes stop_codon:yes gene_type:complete
MGFDVSGINPITDRPEPQPQDFSKKKGVNEENYWKTLTEKQRGKYLQARWDWQKDNQGTYFRNNVWYWRPLWTLVGDLCDDVLTESQWKSGNYNDGVEIRDDQAVAIADILDEALSTGAIDEYEAQWNKEQENERCKYPFEKDNVETFSKFCRLSGGFQIW